ncbi:MAG: signal peptide peptidase SppA [Rhodospirillales bacterium]
MLRFFYGLFAIIGGLTVLLIAVVIAAFIWLSPSTPSAPDRIVLKLDLHQTPVEAGGSGLQALLADDHAMLSDVIGTLLQARNDDRVAGILLLTGDQSPGIAATQELREAIGAFRASGKFVVAFANSFGEGGNGTGAYYLASAADEVWLQPSGDFAVTGISIETPFLKGALDKLGVSVQGGQRYEYKTAPNSLTESDFTKAHRENIQALVDSLLSQIVGDLSKSRGLAGEVVRRLIDSGPLSPTDARAAKLIDKLAYRDEVDSYVLKRAGGNSGLFSYDDYRKITSKPFSKGPVIALIKGVGAITSGDNAYSLASDEQTLGSDDVVEALRKAVDDSDVRAIILRIDSPGGSYVASDTIYREVQRARAKGKPVIVSMGNVAASGGYFIALPADLIVASPGTITGSIGVFGFKPLADQLIANLGINVGQIKGGTNAGMESPFRPYTPEQLSKLNQSLDRIYADFAKKTGAARKMTPQQIDAVARGRVWSGLDAKRLGLIDELGGLTLAIGYAKAAAGIEPNTGIRLKVLPEPKSPLDKVIGKVFGSDEAQMEAIKPMLKYAATLGKQLRELGISTDRGVLAMPPATVRY